MRSEVVFSTPTRPVVHVDSDLPELCIGRGVECPSRRDRAEAEVLQMGALNNRCLNEDGWARSELLEVTRLWHSRIEGQIRVI